MNLDPETLEKIIETHTDVKHIMISLDTGKETFKDHSERLRVLEQQQQLMSGKIAVIIFSIGAAVTLLFNFVISLWNKLQK